MLADRAVLAEPAPEVGRRDREVDRRILLRREPGLGVLGARRHRGAGGGDRKREPQAAYITNATLSHHSSLFVGRCSARNPAAPCLPWTTRRPSLRSGRRRHSIAFVVSSVARRGAARRPPLSNPGLEALVQRASSC